MGKQEYRFISRVSTVKELLVAPKDKDSICKKGGVIYRYRCNQPRCTMKYIGETGMNFDERYKEHLRTSSPSLTIPKLQGTSSNWTTYLSIVSRESQGITGTIKEAMYIRVNDPQ